MFNVNYQVFLTPLVKLNVYGNQIDITDYVLLNSFKRIVKSIDNGDYDIGVYTYADLSLTLSNVSRIFNDENDSSSIFCFSRDKAKIQIKYVDEANGANIVYDGLINDEATQQDFSKDQIKFRVLSLDSIFRKVKVLGGLINDDSLFSTALKDLLNRPDITAVLGYNPDKITVGLDATIDNAATFSQLDSRTVLQSLLSASGSVFFIDNDNEMVIKNRDPLSSVDYLLQEDGGKLLNEDGSFIELEGKSTLKLYGSGDPYQRDNIVKVQKYNNGLQRTFNTVTVNDSVASDEAFVERYGIGSKDFTFDFILNPTTALAIASYYVGEFKQPKFELEVQVKSEVTKDTSILDKVIVDYKKTYAKYKKQKIPIAGSCKAGEVYAPYITNGSSINSNIIWKVTAINYDTKNFLTTLRLRQI